MLAFVWFSIHVAKSLSRNPSLSWRIAFGAGEKASFIFLTPLARTCYYLKFSLFLTAGKMLFRLNFCMWEVESSLSWRDYISPFVLFADSIHHLFSGHSFSSYFFFKSSPRISLLIWERERERETSMWETNINQLPPIHAPTGDRTHNLLVYGTTHHWETRPGLALPFKGPVTPEQIEVELHSHWTLPYDNISESHLPWPFSLVTSLASLGRSD